MNIYKLLASFTIINCDNLCFIGKVEGKIEQLRFEVEKVRRELNSITLKLDNLKALADQTEEYFSRSDKRNALPPMSFS